MSDVKSIAKVCHEANRVLTGLLKDVPVQAPWEECGEDMQKSATKGVQFALDNPAATPEQQHQAWFDERVSQGWTKGAVKDTTLKTHPSLIPYAELSEGVRSKDAIFRAIVDAMK